MSFFDDLFGGGNDPPPPPDYSPLINQAKDTAQNDLALKQEMFDWAKNAYAQNKGVSDQLISRAMSSQDELMANARADRARYTGTFQPLEDELVRDAREYASPDRKEKERGRAMANVGQQMDAGRQNAIRDLESYGINPGAVRYAALDTGARLARAAAQAAAAEQSDMAVDATGRALRSEAIALGQGYPARALQETNLGLNAGTIAGNTGLATTASGASTMGTGTQWGALGNQSTGQAGDLMKTQHDAQMKNYEAGQKKSSGLGTMLGIAAGIGGQVMGLPTASVGGKLLGFEEGGEVPDEYVPEAARPRGAPAIDGVPARLTPGEFVLPKDVVEFYGTQKLQSMIEKARGGKQQGEAKPKMRQALPMAPTFRSPSALPAR